MRTRLRCVLWLAFLFYASTSLAQTATVVHNVNLRADPSTDNPPIRLVLVGESLTLLEPDKTNAYYHVTTAQNEEGWVWSHNVHVVAVMPTPGPGVTPVPTPVPTPSGPANAIDSAWPKPQPQEITFNTDSGTCPEDGDPGSDAATNHLKNRVDTPPAYHLVSFDAIVNLPRLPAGSPISRDSPKWPNVAGQIAPFEGVAVSVEGFIMLPKKESGEHTNCEFTGKAEVDWHIPLLQNAGDPEKLAIVVELTPRVRQDHPGWTDAHLTPGPKFRFSGWLMYDPDHPGQLFDPTNPNKKNKYRQTLWEVHPVTKIEVWQSGAWIDLESLP